VSAYHDPQSMARAQAGLVMPYLVKPVTEADLRAAVAVALARFGELQTHAGILLLADTSQGTTRNDEDIVSALGTASRGGSVRPGGGRRSPGGVGGNCPTSGPHRPCQCNGSAVYREATSIQR